MAESIEESDFDEPEPSPQPVTASDRPAWSEIWQLPVLVVGAIALVAGVAVMFLSRPEPKDDFPGRLREVGEYLQANNLDEAQRILSSEIEPHLERAGEHEHALFWMLQGDLLYLQLRDKPFTYDAEQVRENIERSYRRALALEQPFDGTHVQRFAETLADLGKEEDAFKLLEKMKNEPPQRRYSVVKQIVRRRIDRGAPPDMVADMLAVFLDEVRKETDPSRRRPEEIWAIAVQAQAVFDAGEYEKTIQHLNERFARLRNDGADKDLAPLTLLMAKSFEKLGEFEESKRWYLLTQQSLADDPANVILADVLVGLGNIAIAQSNDVQRALELYSQAETDFPGSPAYLDALIGRGDAEARQGLHPEAIEHLGRAASLLAQSPRRNMQAQRHLETVIDGHYTENMDKGGRAEFELALRYLELRLPLYGSNPPAPLLLALAHTHELLAGKLREAGMAATGSSDGVDDAEKSKTFRRVVFREAANHFRNAAEFYIRHKEAVKVSDDDAFGRSLWKAGENYAKADLWDQAIQVYAEFVKERPGDPLQLQAMRQLGLAYQAYGQFEPAVEIFERLERDHPKSQWTYESLVPMAQCYITLSRIDAAKRTLLTVVQDHESIRPESTDYEQALMQLGKLYHQLGEFEAAIEWLHVAMQRYGSTGQGPAIRFLLADAYRQSIAELNKALDEPNSPSVKAALRSQRTDRLEQAGVLFSEVITELQARKNALTSLEQLYFRNAYFYRADCAYDLGQFEKAIALYDLAAKAWDQDPASMIALIQIVNAYCELGNLEGARAANRRARWQLNRIPEGAFDDPTLPMTRQQWQDWLKWSSEYNLFDQQASADPARN